MHDSQLIFMPNQEQSVAVKCIANKIISNLSTISKHIIIAGNLWLEIVEQIVKNVLA